MYMKTHISATRHKREIWCYQPIDDGYYITRDKQIKVIKVDTVKSTRAVGSLKAENK